MARRPLTVPTSGALANAEDYGDNPTPLAVWVTPDGVVVGGPGAWQSLAALVPQAYAANWAVADWYLDGTVGNDANNGTTALTPLRTGAELMRRLGPYALWGQSVTVHVLANGMTDALILKGAMLVAGTQLTAIGVPTQLVTDVVSAYSAVNHATPIATNLTGTAIADWTPYVNTRVRVTAGPREGVVSWVATASPAGVGLNVARITVPVRRDLVSTSFPTITDVMAVGDSIALETLPTIPSISIVVDGPMLATAGPAHLRGLVRVESLASQQIQITSTDQLQRGRLFFFGCRCASVLLGAQSTTIQRWNQITGCLLSIDDPNLVGTLNTCGVFANCLMGGATRSFIVSAFSEFADCLFQNCRWVGSTANAPVLAFNIQVFDVASAASACSLTYGNVQNLSGSGNAGLGIAANNNTYCVYRGTINLQGAITNAQLSSAPTINLTLPQFLQPSDYAQDGITPAMVAGTTTVTVPWYDNANQRVQATHAVFGGTPGILSVQQISTTQFTITSSNVLDTSTVNWTISPLGRNVFISTV